MVAEAVRLMERGKWYVVHTYSGQEQKVKEMLEKRVKQFGMEDKIFEVLVPTEAVMEIKGGRRQTVHKKVFPGYILVNMDFDEDSWYVVRNTPGVTGFVGGSKPSALSDAEVRKILKKIETEKPKPKVQFEVGETIRIIAGPLTDFHGTVIETNPEHQKLKVLVTIFERETPVELNFDQVEKL